MIGIFDSGIGGVTVFKEILKELPNYKYVYYSDSINNPYGDKSAKELIEITKRVVEYLISLGCKIIVIACNTASSVCKDTLRSLYDVPIIAIEPAYKMVYDNSFKDKTLIMGTKGTINSDKFRELYKKYDNNNTIIYECVHLADIIEDGDKLRLNSYLDKNIKQFKGVKNVVLGCTHYPLIKNELREVLGNVKFYDGSIGVKNRLKSVINEIGLKEEEQDIKFIDSSNNNFKKERFYDILKNSYEEKKEVKKEV